MLVCIIRNTLYFLYQFPRAALKMYHKLELKTKMYSHIVLETGSPKSKSHGKSHSILLYYLLMAILGVPWLIDISLQSVLIFTWGSPLVSPGLHMAILYPQSCGLRVYPIPVWLYLNKLCQLLFLKSPSKVLGLRCQQYF